ncbi:hypothetical protein GLOTRDRAFT_126802 [Gloeophyllum trabeum ATCC 11539]|uniref:Uncharacterized protein n=1 Tax=Gloeophyllum trabeum (strain ATCC 11539 / FP-39264 / Madison 617) TaxID=670483 RepID=S7RZ53_GLOTA|nr:uncharacterized protein GLOTRDRAFT_126802 [Gloeophyllum trabeum ATCC 11539]EPQ58724.1 hypothetical protein GLOTRDRAFT_126802 [Gloeophyllum trabeum ATCC 11539]
MNQVHSTPLQSLLGGFGISLSVHGLLVLNGNVLGISGFLHRAARGGNEALAGVLGLVLGGLIVGAIEGKGPTTFDNNLPRIITSGLLVGMGAKLANGCTSGHMICGISRFSLRSLAATVTFSATGILTALLLHAKSLPSQGSMDWTLSPLAKPLIALQTLPLAIQAALYFHAPQLVPEGEGEGMHRKSATSRLLVFLTSSLDFALALRVSNLTEPLKVIGFLVLPFDRSFDPSLAFLTLGALPLTTLLYRYGRGEHPRLGGPWSVPKSGKVDGRLLFGAAIFGIGWGMEGLCPGPGLVNLGRALSTGQNVVPMAAWISSVIAGGLLY